MNRRASNIFRRVARPSRGARPTDVAESMERAERLDPVVEAVQSVARRVLPAGPLRDLLNGVPFGHPAHAPMTDLPIGCWLSAGVLDLLPGNRRAAGTLVAAGLAGAVPTALAGLADWSSLHREQQRTGLVHAFGTSTATVLYAASLVARLRGRDAVGRALGFAGLTAVLGGAYLGGHLAYRQAAGVSHADPVQHLVPLGWHDLCSLDDLPPGAPVSRRLGYISLFVLRIHDDIHVLTDRCSHLGGPLHQGRIVYDRDDELCVVCPWHGSTFRVDDGAVVHGPATGRQPAFETRVLDNGVVQVRPLP
ncbi:Anthranilate 1,2-dioxygenase ferredoxin subunit [Actinomadura rubteroloni]|uniref:Anthranilate 1,2-dioxygenase ferredoxin subunit n=1 Tax=Actinomadura rubteroloni TaxID=1926885 RepID=A0A2P4ULQ9_9ACTN|nr:Rieske 2Fe-2S domain-containing protein [Actinomadura rubteroloni]POM25986.1 Anthranilate 1,2-dioxygenase ferredoxin subunit [Actinomadura rubteroloni]